MKFKVTRCLCSKGESMTVSINNTRNQENAGEFDSCEDAENYKERLKKQETERIERDRKGPRGWNGNEFVFWIEKGEIE